VIDSTVWGSVGDTNDLRVASPGSELDNAEQAKGVADIPVVLRYNALSIEQLLLHKREYVELDADLDDSGTTVTITRDVVVSPNKDTRFIVGSEHMLAIKRLASGSYLVERGYDGTTAAVHTDGDSCASAGALNIISVVDVDTRGRTTVCKCEGYF